MVRAFLPRVVWQTVTPNQEEDMNAEQAWDYLLDHAIATEGELELVTNGWGRNIQTMETVLYVRTGHDEFPDDPDTELD